MAADQRKLQAEKARLARAEVNDKYWRQQAYRQGNKNQILSAAQEARAGAVSKIASESMWVKEAATLATYLERWQAEDRAELCYRALFRSKGDDGQRLSMTLADLEGGIFDQMRKAIYRERDWQIAGHMEKVFSAAKADTLRVCSGMSWNIARWWHDTWKWQWNAKDPKTGERMRKRQMLAPDSEVPMPEPIPIAEMREVEAEHLQGRNQQHADGHGAEVSSIDATVLQAIAMAGDSTMGGVAASGTPEDPIILAITLDGAGLTDDKSGVRVALTVATVERLNQSTHGVHTIGMWEASEHAEHWKTIIARTVVTRPQLCRLWNGGAAGELLLPDGVGSGFFVKLLLTADKPALCHVLGRRSFAHDYFSPNCKCSENAGQLYDFSMDPLTHYDTLSFEERCELALVPLHEALGLQEPADWKVTKQGEVRNPC